MQRIFCLTESCLVERDPASYAIVTLRPLELIFSIVRDPRDPQLFRIEYTTGAVRSYYSTDRFVGIHKHTLQTHTRIYNRPLQECLAVLQPETFHI